MGEVRAALSAAGVADFDRLVALEFHDETDEVGGWVGSVEEAATRLSRGIRAGYDKVVASMHRLVAAGVLLVRGGTVVLSARPQRRAKTPAERQRLARQRRKLQSRTVTEGSRGVTLARGLAKAVSRTVTEAQEEEIVPEIRAAAGSDVGTVRAEIHTSSDQIYANTGDPKTSNVLLNTGVSGSEGSAAPKVSRPRQVQPRRFPAGTTAHSKLHVLDWQPSELELAALPAQTGLPAHLVADVLAEYRRKSSGSRKYAADKTARHHLNTLAEFCRRKVAHLKQLATAPEPEPTTPTTPPTTTRRPDAQEAPRPRRKPPAWLVEAHAEYQRRHPDGI